MNAHLQSWMSSENPGFSLKAHSYDVSFSIPGFSLISVCASSRFTLWLSRILTSIFLTKLVFILFQSERVRNVGLRKRPRRPEVSVSNKRQTTPKIDGNMLTFKFYSENKLIMLLSSVFICSFSDATVCVVFKSFCSFYSGRTCLIEVSDKNRFVLDIARASCFS